MKRLPWFRMYHEARNDAKLRTLSDAEFRVWFNLLCYVSERSSRGSAEYDPRLIALECAGGDEELLTATVQKLESLRILSLDDNRLTFINFEDRQYDKPSDHPEAVRERVRRHRDVKRDVTRGNAVDQKREENKRTEEIASLPTSAREEDVEQVTTGPPREVLELKAAAREAGELSVPNERLPEVETVVSIASDLAGEFGDGSPQLAGAAAANLFLSNGHDLDAFQGLMYEARRRTRVYQGKQGNGKRIENKAAYWFVTLRCLASEHARGP